MDQRIWELIVVESGNVAILRDRDNYGHIMVVSPNGEQDEFTFC